MRPVFRPEPALPAHAMKTYGIVAPRSTHFRPATCEEVDCSAHLNGWRTVLDEGTELGQSQAHYIRAESGRRFTWETVAYGVAYTFEAGQQCFGSHEVRLDRPEVYVVRDGDFRGNPRGTNPLIFDRPDQWVENFQDHQDVLKTRLERG